MAELGGYAGKILRVDLTNERLTDEKLDEATLRKWIGGAGLGVKILYDEVPGGIEWSDPENRLIWVTGVLSGTKAPASGTYSVVTKGPLTNFLTSAQANGFFGARLKFAGYDAIVVQGAAKRWVYLYVHDGVAELRDAAHLVGRDTWETEDILKKEIGERQLSVSCIGPAGENQVKFAGVCSDRGHIASSNGPGAVMGSKKLKAIAAYGKAPVPISNKQRFKALVNDWWEQAYESFFFKGMIASGGTIGGFPYAPMVGMLPVKNLNTSLFPESVNFGAEAIRAQHKLKPNPCYACRFAHCHNVELQAGSHKGEIVEEPEYEHLAALSSVIGNTDQDAAIWLTHVNDRLGMDGKEQGFLIGLVMECYEKELITKKDTDGLELTWGNVQAVETLLHKIARRDGFGDVLAEGIMRAAEKIGGDAPEFAVYTHKGNAIHVHDSRALWGLLFPQAVSDMGSLHIGTGDAGGDLLPGVDGASIYDFTQAFSEEIPKRTAIFSPKGQFVESLGVCEFAAGARFETLAETVSAVTGWDFTWSEGRDAGERILNLMRAFNIRHGHSREHDTVSPRLVEAPPDGMAKGVSIGPKYEKMVDDYYEAMGWDKAGKPLPETLKRLGLESVINDLK